MSPLRSTPVPCFAFFASPNLSLRVKSVGKRVFPKHRKFHLGGVTLDITFFWTSWFPNLPSQSGPPPEHRTWVPWRAPPDGTAQSRLFFSEKGASTQMRSKPRAPFHACALDQRRRNERTSAQKTVFSCCCCSPTPHRSPPPSFIASDDLECSRTCCDVHDMLLFDDGLWMQKHHIASMQQHPFGKTHF